MPRPRKHLFLTDATIRAAIRDKSPLKLFDGSGLFMYTPTGAWRWEHSGSTTTYGRYPDVKLQTARKLHAQAREQVAEGKSPNEVKKRAKEVTLTFEEIAERWYASPLQQKDWGEGRRKQIRRWLDGRVIPKVGKSHVIDLHVNDYRKFLRGIESPHVAASCKFVVTDVLRYYVKEGECPTENEAAVSGIIELLRDAIEVPESKNHLPLKVEDIPTYLKKLKSYPGHPTTIAAARLLLFLALRKRELTESRWCELDLDKAEWTIPAARMKGRKEHWIPLAPHVVELFRALKALYGDRSEYVFPQERNPLRPLDPWAVNNLLNEVGVEAVPHGLRTTFSSWANERPCYRWDVIERCLAHLAKDGGKVRRIYNKAEMGPERRRLMEDWAEFILAAEGGTSVEMKAAA